MSYTATVYRVFIASPSDVGQERNAIRSIVWEWNSANAASRGMFLEPVGWETHSVPELGDRPQAIINKQILKDADLLIAVFWTRIGTASGSHPSGTVEEIEEHIAAGKPAMIYFSNAPVRPDSVDESQYKALREFRGQLEKRGLIESYSELDEFKGKFTRQLHITLNDATRFPGADSPVKSRPENSQTMRLSEDAGSLLHKAADGGGLVTVTGGMNRMRIQAGKDTIDASTPRLIAKWKNVIEDLESYRFIRDRGHEGRVFDVTENGYRYCEQLKA